MVLRLPRMSAGAHSAMYSGSTVDCSPIPSPRSALPATRTAIVGDHPRSAPHPKKMYPAITSAVLRPRASAIGPAARVPMSAPTRDDVI